MAFCHCCLFIDSCKAERAFQFKAHTFATSRSRQATVLFGHFGICVSIVCLRNIFPFRLLGLSCHACIHCFYTLLRHNQVRAAMFDHVVVQHEGLSWTIGCRPPTERQCVLYAAHSDVSCGADPSLRFPSRLHGPRDEQPRCSFWQDRGDRRPRRRPRLHVFHGRKPRSGRKYRSAVRSWHSSLGASVGAMLF